MAGRLFGGNLSGLAGRHVLITRPRPAAGCPLAEALRQAGARVSEIPMVSVAPVPFSLPALDAYQWLFFTSRNAVQAFMSQAAGQALPDIAAVGPATARLIEAAGHAVRFVPPEFHARAAAEAFLQAYGHQPGRVLWPCGNLANPELKDLLTARGVPVTPLVVYETRPRTRLDPEERALLAGPLDMLVFTSPSAVQALSGLHSFTARPRVACLGPQTARAAREAYGQVTVEATPHTLAALAEAIRHFYESQA